MDTRVIIIREDGFPYIDTARIESKTIVESLPPMQSVRSCRVDELAVYLQRESADVLINLYGSAFPVDAWDTIYNFLSQGGNLLNLGGVPFTVPVRWDGLEWKEDIRTKDYLRQLDITDFEDIDISSVKTYTTLPEEPLLSGMTDDFRCEKAYELHFKLSDGDITSGKSPVRNSILRPLLYATGEDRPGSGRIAAPVIAIDHIYGRFAGGRWVLLNYTSESIPRREMLNRISGFTALGPWEFQIRPSFACYYTDERVVLNIHANRFEKSAPDDWTLPLYLEIKKDNVTVHKECIDIYHFRSPYYGTISLQKPLSPGLYKLEARLSAGDKNLTEKFSPHCITGFWCFDNTLATTAQPLEMGKHSFMRGDKPSLVVGAAYMSPNSQDRLFYDPNPAIWDRDFSDMHEAGINIVHSGIWSDPRRVMFYPGVPNEDAIRAAMAFMLTAANYDMAIVFSLFSFTPEKWDGTNPYTDTECLRAQKEYTACFANRLGKFSNIIWNVINEPIAREDIDEDDFRKWATEIVDTIRLNRNNKQSIILGSADPGISGSAGLRFCSDITTFSAAHVSDESDDLLCSALLSAAPGKPGIVLETGMFGSKFGTESSDHSLEHKLVTTFSSGASGTFEWLYNSDYISTGFLYSSGSQKPLFKDLQRLRTFLRDIRLCYLDRRPESACMIVPEFSLRRNHNLQMRALKTCIKVMHYYCGIPTRVLWESNLKQLGNPKFILVPSAGMLSKKAWDALLKAAKSGSTLVVSGIIEKDERGKAADRLSEFGLDTETRKVAATEKFILFGSEHQLDFGEENADVLEKAYIGGNTGQIKSVPYGDGKLIYTGLPFESARNMEPTVAFYKYALKQTAFPLPFNPEAIDPGILIRPQYFGNGVVYSIVSELDEDKEFDLLDELTGKMLHITLPARRALMFFINNKTREITAQYGSGVTVL